MTRDVRRAGFTVSTDESMRELADIHETALPIGSAGLCHPRIAIGVLDQMPDSPARTGRHFLPLNVHRFSPIGLSSR